MSQSFSDQGKTRIVVDATAAISGGRVYLTQLLSQASQFAAGYEFIVFHTAELDPSLKWGPNIRFHRLAFPALSSGHGRGASIIRMGWRMFVLPWHLLRLRPDLVYSNAGFGPSWRPKRSRLVLALHNSAPLHESLIRDERSLSRRWRLKLLRWLLSWTLSRCDQVIVFSEDLKRRVIARFGHLKSEPVVIYHGIEWGEAERAASPNWGRFSRFGIRAPYLLYVSQWQRYKNVLRLLEAFEFLRSRHPTLSLVLVGEASDQNYVEEIAAMIARLRIGQWVKLLPGCAREELIDIYRGALVFVYPSLAENCPFAVLEAMALGLPLALAKTTSLPEIAGEAAVYFDPENPTEMAEVLDQLLNSQSLRAELSRKAVARARRFSWNESLRQTLRVFESVIRSDQELSSVLN